MATDWRSRLRQAAKLAVVLLIVGPVLVQWGLLGIDLAPAAEFLPETDAALLVRLAGLALVLLVLAALVRQKRRSRGKQSSQRAPEQAADRQVEGSGEVYAPYAYNEQQAARREGERIRKRAEEIAETEREARKRR
jgi:membrane protein implicated in regulation of membrane protease activity